MEGIYFDSTEAFVESYLSFETSAVTSKLNEIRTNWDELLAAHSGEYSEQTQLQARLCQRYFEAILAYLRAAVRDEHVADDLAQEFAFRFIRGDYQNLHPSRGRFRDYIKVVLGNLIADQYRRKSIRVTPIELSQLAGTQDTPQQVLEKDFTDHWRREILRRTWEAFRVLCGLRSTPYYEVLHQHATNTRLTSSLLATRVTELTGKPVSAASVRQMLVRARQMFAGCLRKEIGQSLIDASPASIEEELVDLGLSKYVIPDSKPANRK